MENKGSIVPYRQLYFTAKRFT